MIRLITVSILLVVAAGCSGGDSVGSTSDTSSNQTSPSNSTTTTTDASQTTTTSAPSETTTTAVPDIDIIDVDLTAGDDPGRVQVELGRTVRITVTAAVFDEIHLHGYDLTADVSPGIPAVIEFVADIPGIFELEREESGDRIVELEVSP